MPTGQCDSTVGWGSFALPSHTPMFHGRPSISSPRCLHVLLPFRQCDHVHLHLSAVESLSAPHHFIELWTKNWSVSACQRCSADSSTSHPTPSARSSEEAQWKACNSSVTVRHLRLVQPRPVRALTKKERQAPQAKTNNFTVLVSGFIFNIILPLATSRQQEVFPDNLQEYSTSKL